MYECTTDGNPPSASNKVTACDAVGNTAGKSKFNKTVWKASSVGGLKCTDYQGAFQSMVGQIISAPGAATSCPCPTCKTPPPNVSATNPPLNNIPDLTFKSSLPISAKDGTLPLTCKNDTANDFYYMPTGPFKCVFDTLQSGKYAALPKCVPSSCTYADLVTAASETYMSLVASQCNSSKGTYSHNDVCNYKCSTGYGTWMMKGGVGAGQPRGANSYDGKLTCQYGKWVAASEDKKTGLS